MIHPFELEQATLRSLVAESLAASSADQLRELGESLEALRKAHPDDLSVAITIALEALAEGDSHGIEPALTRLVELVNNSPLEPLAAGARPDARQKALAAGQIPLWLVARACTTRTDLDLKETARKLADARTRGRRPPK